MCHDYELDSVDNNDINEKLKKEGKVKYGAKALKLIVKYFETCLGLEAF